MTLEVLGSLNQDLVAYVDDFPAPGETILAHRLERFLGGKGANQAIAAARLGARTRFLGFVGDDLTGAQLLAQLGEEGIDLTGVVRTASPTGLALIQVNAAGENVITVAGGANGWAHGDFEPPPVSHGVALTQFETELQVIDRFLRSRGGAAHRIINAAPFKASGRDLFPLADFVVVNRGELLAYADAGTSHVDLDLTEAARRLLSAPGQTVIVTLGPDGVLAVSAEQVVRVPGRRAEVIDTTGAGDCFCGALAAALARGSDFVDALRFATVAASLSVERVGAAPSMPRLAEVEQVLAKSA